MTNIPVQAGELVALDYLNEVARAHWRVVGTVDAATAGTVDLLGGQVTINAGAMGSNRKVTCEVLLDLLYNRNTGDSLVLDLRFGGASVITTAGIFPYSGLSATRGIGKLWVDIANSASNAQTCYLTGSIVRTVAGQPTVCGIGYTGAGTINSATAQPLQLFAQWSTGTVGNSIRQLGAIGEVH